MQIIKYIKKQADKRQIQVINYRPAAVGHIAEFNIESSSLTRVQLNINNLLYSLKAGN